MVLDWFYHTCPKCKARSRKLVVRNELKASDKVDGTRTKWSRSGSMRTEEPYSVWLHSYVVEHACRKCGNRWVEHVTKQRPW